MKTPNRDIIVSLIVSGAHYNEYGSIRLTDGSVKAVAEQIRQYCIEIQSEQPSEGCSREYVDEQIKESSAKLRNDLDCDIDEVFDTRDRDLKRWVMEQIRMIGTNP